MEAPVGSQTSRFASAYYVGNALVLSSYVFLRPLAVSASHVGAQSMLKSYVRMLGRSHHCAHAPLLTGRPGNCDAVRLLLPQGALRRVLRHPRRRLSAVRMRALCRRLVRTRWTNNFPSCSSTPRRVCALAHACGALLKPCAGRPVVGVVPGFSVDARPGAFPSRLCVHPQPASPQLTPNAPAALQAYGFSQRSPCMTAQRKHKH